MLMYNVNEVLEGKIETGRFTIISSVLWCRAWRSGESTHLPPMWPELDSQTRRHMWLVLYSGVRFSKDPRIFGAISGATLSQCISKTNVLSNMKPHYSFFLF